MNCDLQRVNMQPKHQQRQKTFWHPVLFRQYYIHWCPHDSATINSPLLFFFIHISSNHHDAFMPLSLNRAVKALEIFMGFGFFS